ncbi:MAG: serine hydrolase [Verrucomicrobiales bacterium]|nr:serine hydrolase [Verrucomicrobiales bacterium]
MPLVRCFVALFVMSFSTIMVRAQLSSASIARAQQYSEAHNGRAMVVQEGGKLRFEKYYSGYSKGEPLHIYSGTKSFFGVLAVIAQEDGLLSLDERVAETVAEWREDPRKSQITIRETLNFTSGLETGFEEIYGRSSEDKIARAVSLEAKRERGQSFIYGPGNMNIFCEVLRRKLKSKGLSYEDYLTKKLIRPLGIQISRWREDAQGNVVPSAGMYMNAQEWIKFGEMINAGGRVGMKQIVGTESLRECFRGTEINPAFGLCFWVNGNAGQPGAREVDVEEELEIDPLPEDWRGGVICNQAPRDLIVSLGSTFQRLYVVPSMDLIVVHHGKPGHEFRDYDFLEILFAGANRTEAAAQVKEKRQTKPIFKKLFRPPGQDQ